MIRKIYNVVFGVNSISALLMACCLDSKSTIPMIVLAINMLVLYALYLIERGFYDDER